MRYIEKKAKLDYLTELIKMEATGCPDNLAKKLLVSKRTLLRYINDLRDSGYPIGYCFYRESYYYINK